MATEITLSRRDGRVVCERCLVAARPLRRMRGLLGRRDLPRGQGILLRPAASIHTFFMRFPIDAVFLGRAASDGSRPVLAARRNLRPWIGIVPLVRGAAGVLELPVGSIDASGTAVGDAVRLG